VSVIIVQPAVPSYRVAFFNRLAEHLGSDFRVYASRDSSLGALNANDEAHMWQRSLPPLRSVFPGLNWQPGVLEIPMTKGDVLVVSGQPRTLSTLALLIRARALGVRTVWWGHFWTSTSKKWRAAIRFALMGLSEAILFYTDQEVTESRARGAIAPRKTVHALNNGLDTKKISAFRDAYNPQTRKRDLLFIGRLIDKAELELLVHALAAPQCAKVTVDIIGYGPHFPDLQRLAQNLEVAERIRWHGSIVDEEAIATIANQCKIFIYPGSVGLSLIHGFAYGLPAILHDDRWTQMPEIAAHQPGQTGGEFEHGSAGSLANAIAGSLAQPHQLKVFSENAIETVTASYNVDDMARRFCALVQSFEGQQK
tara:strand:- start:1953 stop:3053 length:1101 start_codon:yes stop_codon:yes gene_type:complete